MAKKENRDAVYRNAKPKDKPYKVTDGKGLFLLVNPDGAKYWRLAYRYAGKQKTLALGVYAGKAQTTISLEKARELRKEAADQLVIGIDPGEAKKKVKRIEQDKAGNTFEKVALEWHANNLARWQEVTAAKIVRLMEKDIFPEIGKMPVAEITHQNMIAALRKIEARRAHDVAHRAKAFCVRIFSYAIQHGLTTVNPADLKDVLQPLVPDHHAAITLDELPAFLAAMKKHESNLYAPTRIALRLMMLLFIRTSELIETPWSEINLETGEWVIPWQRMKMGKRKMKPVKDDHHVFLSQQAIELLKELHGYTGRGKYLFPNLRDHEKPMSNGAILMALKRMGYQGRMTGHGFRALAMSAIKEKLNYRHEVPDRQLAHKPKSKIDSAYDRAQFHDERKVMMQEWADYLGTIENDGSIGAL